MSFLAEAHNLLVTSHGVHDLHVQTLAAVPNASNLEGHGFGLEKYITHPPFASNKEKPLLRTAPDMECNFSGISWKNTGPDELRIWDCGLGRKQFGAIWFGIRRGVKTRPCTSVFTAVGARGARPWPVDEKEFCSQNARKLLFQEIMQ
jgi:hypothetical protein